MFSHSSCWQNLVLCGHGIEVSVSLLSAVGVITTFRGLWAPSSIFQNSSCWQNLVLCGHGIEVSVSLLSAVGVASEGRIEVVKSIPISFIGKTEV